MLNDAILRNLVALELKSFEELIDELEVEPEPETNESSRKKRKR